MFPSGLFLPDLPPAQLSMHPRTDGQGPCRCTVPTCIPPPHGRTLRPKHCSRPASPQYYSPRPCLLGDFGTSHRQGQGSVAKSEKAKRWKLRPTLVATLKLSARDQVRPTIVGLLGRLPMAMTEERGDEATDFQAKLNAVVNSASSRVRRDGRLFRRSACVCLRGRSNLSGGRVCKIATAERGGGRRLAGLCRAPRLDANKRSHQT